MDQAKSRLLDLQRRPKVWSEGVTCGRQETLAVADRILLEQMIKGTWEENVKSHCLIAGWDWCNRVLFLVPRMELCRIEP
jgi:hypothetical protein